MFFSTFITSEAISTNLLIFPFYYFPNSKLSIFFKLFHFTQNANYSVSVFCYSFSPFPSSSLCLIVVVVIVLVVVSHNDVLTSCVLCLNIIIQVNVDLCLCVGVSVGVSAWSQKGRMEYICHFVFIRMPFWNHFSR